MHLLYQCVCVCSQLLAGQEKLSSRKKSSKATGFPGQEDIFQTTIESSKFFHESVIKLNIKKAWPMLHNQHPTKQMTCNGIKPSMDSNSFNLNTL